LFHSSGFAGRLGSFASDRLFPAIPEPAISKHQDIFPFFLQWHFAGFKRQGKSTAKSETGRIFCLGAKPAPYLAVAGLRDFECKIQTK
jgi:hypothetical protein